MKSDFPHIKIIKGALTFVDGDLIKLPKEYLRYSKSLEEFYKKIMNKTSEEMIIGVDPLHFNFVYSNNHCNIGIIIGSGSGTHRKNAKKYQSHKFSQEFIKGRIKKERQLMSFEDFIPREFVTQNTHELRNLNAKISSNIDALLNVEAEDEWEDKFDRADENIKKIFVASRLIKFILDNIKFYIPDYIQSITLDKNRSFRVHRSVSKIVKIYRNDFKKKKGEIGFSGNSNTVLYGDRELFEIILMLLIENAIKYSNDSSALAPQVEIEDINGKTRVTIKSYGLIVPLEDQSRLFTKGFRSTVHLSIHEGTGMGLHNASELAKLFHGTLKYSSEHVNLIDGREVGWNCFHIFV